MKRISLFLFLLSTLCAGAQDIIMQNGTLTVCQGIFYDSGGELGNYSNNEHYILTLCPDTPGEVIHALFGAFETQENFDVLTIYDGNSTAAPVIGDFSGTEPIGNFAGSVVNTTGCLTFEFVSNFAVNAPGWQATILCAPPPCQSIISQFVGADPAPVNNVVRACQNQEITFYGDAVFEHDGTGATYEWDFGDGTTGFGQTAVHSYANEGAYELNLTVHDAYGCSSSNTISAWVFISTTPDFTGTMAEDEEICLGDTTNIIGVVNAVPYEINCTIPVADVTHLPDGSGVSYETSIPVDCFDGGATVQVAGDILEVCVNMEHAYLGDLRIEIIAPNGMVVVLKDYPGGGGTYLGEPIDTNQGGEPPGVGYTYCFSMDATTLLVNAPEVSGVGNPPGNSKVAGTYRPVGDYNSFVGSPLNGDWTIRVTDFLYLDDGWIFWWTLNFNPDIIPSDVNFEPVIISQQWEPDPSIIAQVDNVITVQPTTEGVHCYTYTVVDDFGCTYTEEVCITVLPTPTAGDPDPIILCDDDFPNDGFNDFTLTDRDAQIINGQADVILMYFETLALAELGDPNDQLISPFTNTIPWNQTVYGRLESTISGCYDITELELVVLESPDINTDPTDYYLCDDDQDGIEIFDLTSKESEIIGLLAGVTLTYHLTWEGAFNGVGALPNPEAYAGADGTDIFVRVENDFNGCFSIAVFTLYFHPVPAHNIPTDYELCDDNIPDGYTEFNLFTKVSEINGGNPDVAVTFHHTEVDAWSGDNPMPWVYTNVSNPEMVYVRIRDIQTHCLAVESFQLIVHPNPVVVTPSPFEFTYCDTDNDGIGVFDFDEIIPILTGGDPLLTVSFHETLLDAHNNLFPIAWPYTNLYNYQPIYIRVENENGCYSVVVITLVVYDSPETVEPDDLILCDELNTNTAVFDLTLVEPQLMQLITDPDNYSISYYETEANAQAGTFPIANPTAYVNLTNPQTIWVVVTDLENACRSIESFQIMLNDMPDITYPVELHLCDVNNPGDMMEAFNLELATPLITGGNTSIVVTYHETQVEAEAGINPLESPYTNVLGNPQPIWIRAVDTITGCVVAGTDPNGTDVYLELWVHPLPSIAEPPAMEVCDPDGNGYHQFFLDEHIDIILGGEPDVTITFHLTWDDAQAGVNPLPTPYENIVAFEQTIFVRGQNNLTGCHVVVELLLIVHTVPEIPIVLPDLVACSQDTNDIGVEFDLTQQDAVVLGDQDPDQHTITYHESLEAAELGTPIIGVPQSYFNTSNPQTIWVRLQHQNTECFSIGSFQLLVNPAPAVADPADIPPYTVCGTGETAEFDLTLMNPIITLGDITLEVQHYESSEDAQNQENQIDPDTVYTNTSNPQTIYVRVYDADTQCQAFTHYTIQVLPNPTPQTDIAPIEECDPDGDGYQEFDLTLREAEIINGEPDVTVSYYETLEDAQNATNAIVNQTAYTNIETPEQIIYVRVERGTTGCYSIVELLIRVVPVPTINQQDYVLCELDSDGFGIFDLQYWKEILLDGQDPDIHTVSYHYTQEDADAGVNAIPEADLDHFPNTSNPMVLYVRITHLQTACYVTGEIQLRVQQDVLITEPAVPLELCEDALGSGMASFDLTVLDLEILSGQEPPIQVDYYTSQEEAEAGINPIEDYTDFYTTTTTIWARVTNPDPNFEEGCFKVVAVELIVNPLPEIAGLLDEYRLCVDAQGNVIEEEFGMSSPPVIDTGLSTPEYEFEWYINGVYQPGELQGYITASESGTYTVKIINGATRCENEYSTQVYLSSPPLEYSAVTSPAFAGRHSITVLVEGLGDYMYSLDDGPFQDSNYFEPVSPGKHIITITDKNGCGTVKLEVTIIDYPQFFTPNEDGYHDTWNIIGIEAYPTAKIYIFDRYGKLLKQLSPTGSGWDGTYNGRPLPSNDYWFRVEYEEDGVVKNFRGHITLKR